MADAVFTCEEVLAPYRNGTICAVCSLPFTAMKSGAKYCSQSCRERRPRPDRKPRASGKHRIEQRSCKACSGIFAAKTDNDRMFCADQCRLDWASIKKAINDPAAHRVYRCKCEGCSVRFERAYHVRYCSKECNARAIGKAATKHLRTERVCPECNKTHTPSYGRSQRIYCSNECAKKHNKRVGRLKGKAKRRAAVVERVDPIKVFERDGWRCHLCGCKTPRRLRGTFDPSAPELDHIVPIARGGDHSYINTACACRQCNGAKSDSIIGQMLLFG